MLPQTDIHKIVGYFGAIIVTALARYGFNLPLEVCVAILNGLIILISTLVGKKTNPTGANTSTAREALEPVVRARTAEMPVYKTSKMPEV